MRELVIESVKRIWKDVPNELIVMISDEGNCYMDIVPLVVEYRKEVKHFFNYFWPELAYHWAMSCPQDHDKMKEIVMNGDDANVIYWWGIYLGDRDDVTFALSRLGSTRWIKAWQEFVARPTTAW